MIKPYTFIAFFFFLLLAACDNDEDTRYGAEEKKDLLALSFPRISLGEKERIVGLEISIRHGSVKAITNIPEDWSIALNTDPSWNSTVTGNANHGAGALDDLSKLDSLLLIQPWHGKDYTFTVEVSVITTTDFEKTARQSIGMADLILSRKN